MPDVNAARARLNFAEYLGDSVKLHLEVGGEPFPAKVAETRYAEMRELESGAVTVAGTSRTGTSLSSESGPSARTTALAEIEEVEAQLGEKPLAVAATSGIKRSPLATFLWELESQNGAVVRMARESGVEVPTHELIYAKLKPLEEKARAVFS